MMFEQGQRQVKNGHNDLTVPVWIFYFYFSNYPIMYQYVSILFLRIMLFVFAH